MARTQALMIEIATGDARPISRQIVEHFGGRMWLRDDTPQGACFCFSLPWQAQDIAVTDGDKT